MKIAIFQYDIEWENKNANFYKLHNILKNGIDADILILPEMFSTGFSVNTNYLAENINGDTIRCIAELSSNYNIAICGSFIAEEDGKYYNKAFFVTPNGEKYFYNKRHLFILGEEPIRYEKGTSNIIINYNGWKIALFVCFDLRFPVWTRNRNNELYDIAIYVANWPQVRIKEWESLLTARAIENQAYVCGANRVGKAQDKLIYNGHSQIYDYKGILQNETRDDECIIIQKLDKEKLNNYREVFPVLKCQDNFIIK